MHFLIPWSLLEWARDNRVLRVRWFGLEAEFAVEAHTRPASGPSDGPAATLAGWEPPSGLPLEEQERRRKEHERAEAEKVLYHSA